jgi:alkylhydroperoxidase family enzyme
MSWENYMSWILNGKQATSSEVHSLRPTLATEQLELAEHFWLEELVPPVVLELCRLRIAQLHKSESELLLRREEPMLSGLTEEKIAQLPYWFQNSLFSEGEKACIETAELFFQEPSAITDALAAEVIDLLGEPAYISLIEALNVFDGFARSASEATADSEPAV